MLPVNGLDNNPRKQPL